MRKNFPVNNVETSLRPDQYLISRTDLKGRITYANPAFIDVSGFTRDELLGKAHNIVRHPDVPPLIYQDLWNTLQAGKPWLGVVKNRRKDGGYYWVLANAAPIVQNGEVTGYASVRVKATPKQIAAANTLYEEVNAGANRGYSVRGGQKVHTGWRRWLGLVGLPFAPTLRAGMFRQAVLSLAAIGTATWHALNGGLDAYHPWLGAAAVGTLTAASLLYGWLLARRVTESLTMAAGTARQIAAGNLDIDIPQGQADTLGELYFSLDLMRKSLVNIAENVREGVHTAGHTAEALAHRNQELSLRTEDQAASLQSTAASMEEITVTVRQNTDNAHQASQLANDSMRIAQRGGAVVNDVVQAMQSIHESSRRISDIVSLIEEIAFQTNILALNAAVESARAGEAGRGFAVVAGEVRNLAQRSSKAAGEIKALIDESVSRMADGSEHAAAAGETMQEIVDAVERVTDIMSEISLASTEQATGLMQINAAITQIDGATRDNTALVQDLGSTVAELNQETTALHQAIDVLSTRGHQHRDSTSARRARHSPHVRGAGPTPLPYKKIVYPPQRLRRVHATARE